MNNRDSIRASLLATPTFRSIQLTAPDGSSVEVRQPTIKKRRELRKLATVTDDNGKMEFDPMDFMLYAAIECSYVPGTEDRIFTTEDYAILSEMPSGGFIDELINAASDLLNVDDAKAKKDSSKTASDS